MKIQTANALVLSFAMALAPFLAACSSVTGAGSTPAPESAAASGGDAGSIRTILQTPDKGAHCLGVSGDGRYIAFGANNANVTIRRLSDNLIVSRIRVPYAYGVALSHDGSRLAAITMNLEVKVVDAFSGKQLAASQVPHYIGDIKFVGGDKQLWLAVQPEKGARSVLLALDALDPALREMGRLQSDSRIRFLETDIGRNLVAFATEDGWLRVYDGSRGGIRSPRDARKLAAAAAGMVFEPGGDTWKVLLSSGELVKGGASGVETVTTIGTSLLGGFPERAVFIDGGEALAVAGRTSLVPDVSAKYRLSILDMKSWRATRSQPVGRNWADLRLPIQLFVAAGKDRMYTNMSASNLSTYSIGPEGIAPDQSLATVDLRSLEGYFGGRGLRLQYVQNAQANLMSSAVSLESLSSEDGAELYADFPFGGKYADPVSYRNRGWTSEGKTLGLASWNHSYLSDDPDQLVFIRDDVFHLARRVGGAIETRKISDIPAGDYNSRALSRDGRILVLNGGTDEDGVTWPNFEVFDLSRGTSWKASSSSAINEAVVSPRGTYVVGADHGTMKTVGVYDARKGTWLGEPDLSDVGGARDFVGGFQYAVSVDESRMAVRKGGSIAIVALPGLKLLGKLENLEPVRNGVVDMVFSEDGGQLFLRQADRMLVVSLATGQLVSFTRDDRDWLFWTEDGYFEGSRGAGRFLAVVQGDKAFAIDQFAARLNRPDILMERLGADKANPELHAFFRERHARRLARMGLSEEDLAGDLALPVARIDAFEVAGSTATLRASFSDAGTGLARYTVYVNDVPLFGAGGRPLSGGAQSVELPVRLAAGTNRVEVSCFNASGAESLRVMTRAEGPEAVTRPELYYLGFGVSEYANPDLDLNFAHKDALDLAQAFARMEGRAFAKVHVETFTDAEVRGDTIAAAKAFLSGAGEDDVAVLFIAGHGVYTAGSADPDYYYVVHDTDIRDLPGTAIRFEEIEDLLQGIPSRRKLFLIDTCNSGEVDPAVSGGAATAGPTGATARAIRGLSVVAAQGGQGVPRRTWLEERNRYIRNDLLRRSGAVVLSSCKGGEYSYETEEAGNGLFTRALLDGLEPGTGAAAPGALTVSMRDLAEYVQRAVPETSGGLQHPGIDRDNLLVDFDFAVVEGAK